MKPRYFLNIVTMLNVLVAAFFAMMGLISPKLVTPAFNGTDPATNIFAMYAAARAVPLAVMTLIAIIRKRNTEVMWLAILAGIVQLSDGCIGLYLRDLSKFIGPFLLAAVQFGAVYAVKPATKHPA